MRMIPHAEIEMRVSDGTMQKAREIQQRIDARKRGEAPGDTAASKARARMAALAAARGVS